MIDDYINPEELIEDDEDFDIEVAQLEEIEEKAEEVPCQSTKKAREATCGDIEDEYFSMAKKNVPQDQIFLVLARKYGYTPYEIEMIVL